MHANIERDMRRMHEGMADGMRMGRDQRAAHLRNMRRMRDSRRAGPGAHGSWWAYWWLIFPLVFWVLPSMGRWDWSFPLDFGRAGGGLMSIGPVSWFVEAFAKVTGMSVGDAGAVLLLAAVVNGAALLFALRQTAPRT